MKGGVFRRLLLWSANTTAVDDGAKKKGKCTKTNRKNCSKFSKELRRIVKDDCTASNRELLDTKNNNENECGDNNVVMIGIDSSFKMVTTSTTCPTTPTSCSTASTTLTQTESPWSKVHVDDEFCNEALSTVEEVEKIFNNTIVDLDRAVVIVSGDKDKDNDSNCSNDKNSTVDLHQNHDTTTASTNPKGNCNDVDVLEHKTDTMADTANRQSTFVPLLVVADKKKKKKKQKDNNKNKNLLVLLIHPEKKLFEVVLLPYNSSSSLIDLLSLIPKLASIAVLQAQTHVGLYNLQTETDLLLSSVEKATPVRSAEYHDHDASAAIAVLAQFIKPCNTCNGNQNLRRGDNDMFLVAIPKGYTGKQVNQMSFGILKNGEIDRVIQKRRKNIKSSECSTVGISLEKKKVKKRRKRKKGKKILNNINEDTITIATTTAITMDVVEKQTLQCQGQEHENIISGTKILPIHKNNDEQTEEHSWDCRGRPGFIDSKTSLTDDTSCTSMSVSSRLGHHEDGNNNMGKMINDEEARQAGASFRRSIDSSFSSGSTKVTLSRRKRLLKRGKTVKRAIIAGCTILAYTGTHYYVLNPFSSSDSTTNEPSILSFEINNQPLGVTGALYSLWIGIALVLIQMCCTSIKKQRESFTMAQHTFTS